MLNGVDLIIAHLLPYPTFAAAVVMRILDVLVLVLVVDGLCSQLAVYAHITPVSIQSVLKSID